jgi:serine/threonine-protein kinase
MLAAQGRFDASVGELRRAQELDPLSAIIQTDLGLVLFYAGRFDEAVAASRSTLQVQPDFKRAHSNLMRVHEWQQRCEDAAGAARQASGEEVGGALLAACARGGMRGYWEARLAQVDAALARTEGPAYLPQFERAVTLAALDRGAEAVATLERAREAHSYLLVWLRVQPQLRALAAEPGYAKLVAEVGLATIPR